MHTIIFQPHPFLVSQLHPIHPHLSHSTTQQSNTVLSRRCKQTLRAKSQTRVQRFRALFSSQGVCLHHPGYHGSPYKMPCPKDQRRKHHGLEGERITVVNRAIFFRYFFEEEKASGFGCTGLQGRRRLRDAQGRVYILTYCT